jgi:hypothetical protein
MLRLPMKLQEGWRRFLRNSKYAGDVYKDASLTLKLQRYEFGLRTKAAINRRFGVATLEDSDLAIAMAIQREPAYGERQRLRTEHGTEPGVIFLQSNMLGTLSYATVGLVAAEGVNMILKYTMPEAAEETRSVLTSAGTFGTQLVFAFTPVVVNELREKKEFYRDDAGRFHWKKFVKGFGTFLALNLAWDAVYGPTKTMLQTYLQNRGYAPGLASSHVDWGIGIPIYYTAVIQMGLTSKMLDLPEKYEKD